MTRRYRATKLRTTLQTDLGAKVPEKREQLPALERFIMEESGMVFGRVALLSEVDQWPYEDLSPFYERAREEARKQRDEEVRQRGENLQPVDDIDSYQPLVGRDAMRGERAKARLASCSSCGRGLRCFDLGAYACIRCEHLYFARHQLEAFDSMGLASRAFAELGRIVGEHLSGTLYGLKPDPKHYEFFSAARTAPVLTESAPVKAKHTISPEVLAQIEKGFV